MNTPQTETAVPEPHRGGHWVRLEDDGRAHCRDCDWVSTSTGAAAVDQGANHSADNDTYRSAR